MDTTAILLKTSLFSGIQSDELSSMLTCLSTVEKSYKKGEFIFRAGESTSTMGMVLTGSVLVFKDDFWGNRSIISEMSVGNLFGETYACTPAATLEVNVMAATDVTILFMDIRRLLTTCPSACQFHSRLIRNLLSVLSGKNLMLTRKMEHMAQKTTRAKLLSYLSSESLKHHSADFEIPYNRQQLADYLSVDRSAMSNELGKMRDEGLIEFNKNHFHLNEEIL